MSFSALFCFILITAQFLCLSSATIIPILRVLQADNILFTLNVNVLDNTNVTLSIFLNPSIARISPYELVASVLLSPLYELTRIFSP
jgi:hypothetical protein